MNNDSNPVVQLTPNSVYIATSTILSDGFHWALYVTDENNRATRHEWQQEGLIEEYKSELVHPVRTYTENYNMVLAYLRVRGCTPPPDSDGGTTAMERICRSIFPDGSKPSVMENRAAGMSCRTWLLKVLKELEVAGFLVRENGIDGIEDGVKGISAREELKSADNKFEISFVGEI
jgi:hypothetical protein